MPSSHRRKRTRIEALLAAALLVFCARATLAFPEMGFLQFRPEHNLEFPGCLAAGDCFLDFEVEAQALPSWLGEIRTHSNLGVLHWDRGVPWLAFDIDLPPGADRVTFFDARLDAETVAWLDAFDAHFAALGRRYVAVSLLNGSRTHYAPLFMGESTGAIPAAGPNCPDFSPGANVVVDPGTGAQTVDAERSYRNFLLYLYDKLAPDYFGLVVEANLVEETCPARASGLYALYRALHDDVEAEVGTTPLLFATVSLPPLLDYARTTCFPTSLFTPCAAPLPPSPASSGPEACFPSPSGTLAELDQGGRLDLLALSFYPDSLEMSPVAGVAETSQGWPLADWQAGAACTGRLRYPDLEDPFAALDFLGWNGPMAFAEVSARACRSPIRLDLPNAGGGPPDPWVFETAGSIGNQVAWTERLLSAAIERDFLFFNHSFLRDYRPAGTWTVEAGILPADLQALFNIWPCSGLQDAQGVTKPAIAATGLPEPGFGLGLLIAVGALASAPPSRQLSRRRPSRSRVRAACFARRPLPR